MRRTIHAESLPSHTTLKRRRIERSDVPAESSATSVGGSQQTPAADEAPISPAQEQPLPATPLAPPPISYSQLNDIDGDSSDDEDDDESYEALLAHRQAFDARQRQSEVAQASAATPTPSSSTQAANAAPQGVAATTTASVASYNRDVLFRSTGKPAVVSEKDKLKQKLMRHSSLQQSSDHGNFMKKYFK